MRGSFYLHEKSYGEITLPEKYNLPLAYVWGCPRCGEIWARMVPDLPTTHMFWSSPCHHCGGGKLLLWDVHPLEHLPLILLAREIDFLLKENNDENRH